MLFITKNSIFHLFFLYSSNVWRWGCSCMRMGEWISNEQHRSNRSLLDEVFRRHHHHIYLQIEMDIYTCSTQSSSLLTTANTQQTLATLKHIGRPTTINFSTSIARKKLEISKSILSCCLWLFSLVIYFFIVLFSFPSPKSTTLAQEPSHDHKC